jgi:hypothetical protein
MMPAETRITSESGKPFDEVAKEGEMDSLDEFVAADAFIHIERMAANHVWLAITTPDGRRWHVNLHAASPIAARVLAEDKQP